VASHGWLWRFIRPHADRLDHVKAYSQEDIRLNVTKEIARSHIVNLERHVQNVPTDLIFNIDEVGSQDWADRKLQSVIVPHQFRHVCIEYSVSRSEKQINCIVAISLSLCLYTGSSYFLATRYPDATFGYPLQDD
jgi:hypothetical protein